MDHSHDLEDYLVTIEDKFYSSGFEAGRPHGRLHGLFDGRALGREKAWELWEEVGHYEGVCTLWLGVLTQQGARDTR